MSTSQQAKEFLGKMQRGAAKSLRATGAALVRVKDQLDEKIKDSRLTSKPTLNKRASKYDKPKKRSSKKTPKMTKPRYRSAFGPKKKNKKREIKKLYNPSFVGSFTFQQATIREESCFGATSQASKEQV